MLTPGSNRRTKRRFRLGPGVASVDDDADVVSSVVDDAEVVASDVVASEVVASEVVASEVVAPEVDVSPVEVEAAEEVGAPVGPPQHGRLQSPLFLSMQSKISQAMPNIELAAVSKENARKFKSYPILELR